MPDVQNGTESLGVIEVPPVMPTPQVPIGSGFGTDSTAAEVIAGHDLTGNCVKEGI